MTMEGQYRDSAVAAGRNEACIADRIKALQVPEQAPSAAVLMSIPLPPAGYDGALQNLCAYQVCRRGLNKEETGSCCADF